MNGCLEAVLNESFIKPKTNMLLVSMPGDIWTSFKSHQKLPQKNQGLKGLILKALTL